MKLIDIEGLQRTALAFAEARGWRKFHNPKNLAMALSVEVAELVEIFQWKTPEESAAVMESGEREHVEQELADIAIYLSRARERTGRGYRCRRARQVRTQCAQVSGCGRPERRLRPRSIRQAVVSRGMGPVAHGLGARRPGGAAFACGALQGRVQVLPATPRRLQLRLPETEQQ